MPPPARRPAYGERVRRGARRSGRGARTGEAPAIPMRTPGDDFALAAGFLVSEGVLGPVEEPRTMTYCAVVRVGDVEPASGRADLAAVQLLTGPGRGRAGTRARPSRPRAGPGSA